MKLDIVTLEGGKAGSLELSDTVFGLEPRADLLARMVRYQLAKRRAGATSISASPTMPTTGKGRVMCNALRGRYGPQPSCHTSYGPTK